MTGKHGPTGRQRGSRGRRYSPIAAAAACLVGAVLLAALLISSEAFAHTRSISFAIWTIEGRDATVRLEIAELDRTVIQATSAAGRPAEWQALLPTRVQLLDAAGACAPDAASLQSLDAPAGRLRFGWRVRCTAPDGPRRVRSDLLFDAVRSHVQLATIRRTSEHSSVDVVLTESQREVAAAAATQPAANAWRSVAGYLALGVEHILTGFDHLVFLLALLLIARTLRQVAGAITGFTIGHSITLSLAVLGYTRANVPAVEALIGLSIAVVAAENVWHSQQRRRLTLPVVTVALIGSGALAALLRSAELGLAVAGVGLLTACSFGLQRRLPRPQRLRWAIAGLFGLVHGFGFAGALESLAPSTEQLAASLFSFNLGVELGQLGCVALLWPLLVVARRRGHHDRVVQWGSAAAAALGTYWFVLRTFS